MLTNQALQLRNELARQPQPQVGFDPHLGRLQTELFETRDVGLRPSLIHELLEGMASPQCEAISKSRRSGCWIDLGDEPRLGDALLEPCDIEIRRIDRHDVTRGPGQQDRAFRPLWT